jgi:uncharacterized protein YbaR (Trm112 family)
MSNLEKDLLDILACPKCKSAVQEQDNSLKCTNSECGLIYPVRDGIPVMLISEAQES